MNYARAPPMGYPPQPPPPGMGYPAPAGPWPAGAPPGYGMPPPLAPAGPAMPPTLQQQAKDAFALRIVAFIIDAVVIGVPFQILVAPLLVSIPLVGAYVASLVWGTIFFIYAGVMTAYRAQTIGKMVMGLKVVKEDGLPLTQNEAFTRSGEFILWGATFGIVALLAFIWVADKGQRLGDQWAHTYVIKAP